MRVAQTPLPYPLPYLPTTVEDTTVREGEKEGNRGAGRSGGRWRAPESGRRGSRAASAGDPLEQVPAPHRRSRSGRCESLRRWRRFPPGRAAQVPAVGGAGPGGGRGGDGVERRGRVKSAGDEWMHRVEARAATTAAQGRARASRETTTATTAALDGVVDDGFHGGWRGTPRSVAA